MLWRHWEKWTWALTLAMECASMQARTLTIRAISQRGEALFTTCAPYPTWLARVFIRVAVL